MVLGGKEFDHTKYREWIDPNDVTPYDRNAKRHTEKQITRGICASISIGWRCSNAGRAGVS